MNEMAPMEWLSRGMGQQYLIGPAWTSSVKTPPSQLTVLILLAFSRQTPCDQEGAAVRRAETVRMWDVTFEVRCLLSWERRFFWKKLKGRGRVGERSSNQDCGPISEPHPASEPDVYYEG